MRRTVTLLFVMTVGAALLVGCQAMPPTREALNVPYDQAWTAMNEVMSARLISPKRSAEDGWIEGFTGSEEMTGPAPGIGGSVLGRESSQTIRRRVAARLDRSDGVMRLTVSAWVQQYDRGARQAVTNLDRDPGDVATYGANPPAPPIPTWIDLRRDETLELELLQAIKDRLTPS